MSENNEMINEEVVEDEVDTSEVIDEPTLDETTEEKEEVKEESTGEFLDMSEITGDVPQKRWYVVNTYSGHENRVKENLEKRIETMGIQNDLFRVLVAEEELYDDKKKIVKKNMFPGYVFVEMSAPMTDDAWYVVRNTPGVTGFIGSSGGGVKPFPVSHGEMNSILRRMGQGGKNLEAGFEVGDKVRILSGPFSGTEGTVFSMNDQTQSANVLIFFVGRETPTEVDYKDLQKVEE